MRERKQSHISKGPITVLHIAPTPFFSDRGCHMRVRGIILGLNNRGLNNILCTYHHGRDVAGIETIRTPRIPGYTKEEAGPTPFKYLADIFLFFKVCGVIYKRNPQVIHGHLHEGVLIGWMAKTIFFWQRIPLVFDVQGSLVGELESHGYFKHIKPLRKVFWAMEYLITKLPRYFVCSSQGSARILQQQFCVSRSKIAVVNDGVDTGSADANTLRALWSRLDLPEGIPLIVYTGALLQAKGLDTLYKIILETKQRQIQCRFLIVGYPDRSVRAFIEENDLQGFCTVVGRVPYEQLKVYLGLATMAIEPKDGASGEASGKLLNYMGAGLPVLCFDTQSNRQILGESGYYVSAGSASGFVEHIMAVINSPQLAAARGAQGRERVNERFSWDTAAERLCSVYRVVTNGALKADIKNGLSEVK